MKTQIREKQRNMVLSAMFAAIIMLTTAYLFHIPIGANGGYIHLGDAFIYLAACFMPMPYACAAACIGGGLADLMSGAAMWMIPTMIIKPLMALWFTSKKEKLVNARNILALFGSWAVCVGGYYIAEGLLFGNWVAPLAGVWGNTVQSAEALCSSL